MYDPGSAIAISSNEAQVLKLLQDQPRFFQLQPRNAGKYLARPTGTQYAAREM
jgi:hypothetical protein